MLWLLKRTGLDDRGRDRDGRIAYDEVISQVVRAPQEQKARELAASAAGDEGPAGWLDPGLSSCEPLQDEGPDWVVIQNRRYG